MAFDLMPSMMPVSCKTAKVPYDYFIKLLGLMQVKLSAMSLLELPLQMQKYYKIYAKTMLRILWRVESLPPILID